MPIKVNENGILHELLEVYENENGVMYELDTVHSNEGGVLREIHSAWKPPDVSWSSSAGNLSVSDDNLTGTMTLSASAWASASYNLTASFSIKRSTILSLAYDHGSGSYYSSSNVKIYKSGSLLYTKTTVDSQNYTIDEGDYTVVATLVTKSAVYPSAVNAIISETLAFAKA